MTLDEQSHLGGAPFPLYLRKLDKKSRWGHPDDAIADRVAVATTETFPYPGNCFSLYLIRSMDDLRRVVVALNLRRNRRNNDIDLVGFLESEITASEIQILQVPGETDCAAANVLHVDISSSSQDSFSRLCRLAMNAGREAVRIGKTSVAEMLAEQINLGCEAITDNAACGCRHA